jgi:hypothetical protein
VGISQTTVSQILKAQGLKPHLVKTFGTSDDPEFKQKLEDVVRLYLAPPENSIVFGLDEKSQIQAPGRAQPILPLRSGIPQRQSHDHIRHETTLFAALTVASGKVIGECRPRHTGAEYLTFLKLVDKKSLKAMVLPLIVDNVSSHKTKEVKAYLASKSERLSFTTNSGHTHDFDVSMHPAEPGFTLLQGNSITVTLPECFAQDGEASRSVHR